MCFSIQRSNTGDKNMQEYEQLLDCYEPPSDFMILATH